MATFLELVQDVARESGTLAGGSSLNTVQSQTGRAQKIVQWTARAWRNIQLERRDWSWMQIEFESVLEEDVLRYDAADLDVDRLGRWAVDTPDNLPWSIYATGEQDQESRLEHLPYHLWRARYDFGTHDPGKPICYAISPQRELCVGPAPDDNYVIRGGYTIAPQMLEDDDDVPEMPEEYHGAIVWEALKLLAIADEANMAVTAALSEYALARQTMIRDLLPECGLRYECELR